MTYTAIAAGDPPANSNIHACSEDGTLPLIELCKWHDRLWNIALDRVGGTLPSEDAIIAAMLDGIVARPADSLESAMWRANLLARAVLNDWEDRQVTSLAQMVQQDSESFGIGVRA